MNFMTRRQKLSLALISTLMISIFTGCQSVPQPKGSSEGYTSAKFVRTAGIFKSDALEDSPIVNEWVRNAIINQFNSNGIDFGTADAELELAYIIMRQDSVMTVVNDDYFGPGRSSTEIMHLAHKRGVIDKNGGYNYEAGAIIIDVLDTNTGELVYRDFAVRDIISDADSETRKQRINDAVAEALAKFFK